MMYGRMTMCFVGMMLAAGCVTAPPERTAPTPVEPTLPAESRAQGDAYSDDVYKAGLQRYITSWDQRIEVLLQSIQQELDHLAELLLVDMPPDERRFFTHRKRLLHAYNEKLKAIQDSQQELMHKDGALAREAVYVQLLTRYVTCLRIEEKLREGAAVEAAQGKALEKMEVAFHRGDYQEVADLFEKTLQQNDGVSGGETEELYYAVALYRLGRVEEAASVAAQRMAEKLDITCSNAHLAYDVGELLIEAERYEVAEEVFQALIDYYQAEDEWYGKAQKKLALFQSDLNYVRARNKLDQAIDFYNNDGGFSDVYNLCKQSLRLCPDQSCRQEVHTVLEQMVMKTAAGIERTLQRVDELIAAGTILEAHELMTSLRTSFPEDSYPPLLADKIRAIDEKVRLLHQEEAKWKDELEHQKFEKALKLLEGEQYDEAIVLLGQFEGTRYEQEAQEKKSMAVDLYARTSRAKAAQLVQQARQSPDAELQKTYLIQSYTLLKNVLDRYPANQYAEKIARNLEAVRNELERVYPDFLLKEHSGSENSW